MGTPVLPKMSSKAFKDLYVYLSTVFKRESFAVVCFGALERKRIEKILLRQGVKAGALKRVSRQEVIAALVANFFRGPQIAHDIVKELDKAAHSELSLLGSMPAQDVVSRFHRLESLRLQRHGAKMLWAICRDERPVVRDMGSGLIEQYMRQAQEIEEEGSVQEEISTEERLKEFEHKYQAAAERVLELEDDKSQAERERAHLVAEIGHKEAQLRQEGQKRKALAREIQGQEKPKVLSPPPPRNKVRDKSESAHLQRKIRSLKKRLDGYARKDDEMGHLRQDLEDAQAHNQQLLGKIERMRDLRAQELAVLKEEASVSKSEVAVPLTQKPAKSRTHQSTSDVARVGVFLDVANLAGAARLLHQGALDYGKVLEAALRGRSCVLARAYVIDKGQDSFADFAQALRTLGYKVCAKRPKTFADGTMKADWDVGITVEMLSQASHLDVVVLGSGDGDYLPALHRLKEQGIRVELLSFAQRSAKELKAAVDDCLDLDESYLLV